MKNFYSCFWLCFKLWPAKKFLLRFAFENVSLVWLLWTSYQLSSVDLFLHELWLRLALGNVIGHHVSLP